MVTYLSISIRKIHYTSRVILRVWSPDHPYQCYLGPVRNANSQALSQTYWIRSSAAGVQQSLAKQALQVILISLKRPTVPALLKVTENRCSLCLKFSLRSGRQMRFSFLHITKAKFIVFSLCDFKKSVKCTWCVFCEAPLHCISPHCCSMRIFQLMC